MVLLFVVPLFFVFLLNLLIVFPLSIFFEEDAFFIARVKIHYLRALLHPICWEIHARRISVLLQFIDLYARTAHV